MEQKRWTQEALHVVGKFDGDEWRFTIQRERGSENAPWQEWKLVRADVMDKGAKCLSLLSN